MLSRLACQPCHRLRFILRVSGAQRPPPESSPSRFCLCHCLDTSSLALSNYHHPSAKASTPLACDVPVGGAVLALVDPVPTAVLAAPTPPCSDEDTAFSRPRKTRPTTPMTAAMEEKEKRNNQVHARRKPFCLEDQTIHPLSSVKALGDRQVFGRTRGACLYHHLALRFGEGKA